MCQLTVLMLIEHASLSSCIPEACAGVGTCASIAMALLGHTHEATCDDSGPKEEGCALEDAEMAAG